MQAVSKLSLALAARGLDLDQPRRSFCSERSCQTHYSFGLAKHSGEPPKPIWTRGEIKLSISNIKKSGDVGESEYAEAG